MKTFSSINGLGLKWLFAISIFYFTNANSQTSNITQGCFPLTVNFTAPAGHPNHYWDFGDGATSTQVNPSNTYITAGNFEVKFRETPTGPVVGTLTINVYPKPIPNFTTVNSSGCAPLLVNFFDNTALSNGISITNYSWVFSDGGNTTGANPSHTFNKAGKYNVSLAITTNLPSCNSSKQYSNVISVSDNPVINISTNPSPATSCTLPFNLSFINNSTTNSGSLTYFWDFGDNSTSTSKSPNHIYTVAGTYTAKLTATNSDGCSSTGSIRVSIGDSNADFEIPDTICLNSKIKMKNTSTAGNYFWTFDSGTSLANSNLKEPTVEFSTVGYHDIKLNLLSLCPDDTTVTVYVHEVDASFTSTPNISCSNPVVINYFPNNPNGLVYNWGFTNAQTSNLIAPTITYDIDDTTIYSINGPYPLIATLEIIETNGCKNTFTLSDTLFEPNALIIPDKVKGCSPVTVDFEDRSNAHSNIVSWKWHFGDGNVLTAANSLNQTHTYTAEGIYNAFLVIETANGCTDTSYNVAIYVGNPIALDFDITPKTVCIGDQLSFTNLTSSPYIDSVDSWHYYAEDGRMTHCFDIDDPTWKFTHETGPQDITLVGEFNGCYSQVTKAGIITVNGPMAEYKYSIDCANSMAASFTDESQMATDLLWEFGDGNTSSVSNPVHTYSNTGDYQVKLTSKSTITGCPDDIRTMLVRIRNVQAVINMDSIICLYDTLMLDAGNSVDVIENCYEGYTWFFGEPNKRPITTQNALDSMEVTSTGVSNITLVVKDLNDCTDTAHFSYKSFGIVSNFVISDDTVCAPVTIQLNELGQGDTTLVSWEWEFQDNTGSNLLNPSLTLDFLNVKDDDTLFSVNLIIKDTIGCTHSISKEITIYKPVSEISALDNFICSGDAVTFFATDFTTYNSNLLFNWNFGDGFTSKLQNPIHPYPNQGNYNVKLDYEEISTGCKNDATFKVEVKDYPLADFKTDFDSILYLCPKDNVLLTNLTTSTNAVDYFWDFGNGLTSDLKDPGTVFDVNGLYSIKLVASLPAPFGCADSIVKNYRVQAPSGNFMMDIGNDTICRSEFVEFNLIDTVAVDTFYWDFGDGTGAGSVSPVSHQYTFIPPSGKTFAKLVMSNSDGSCPQSQDLVVNMYEIIADFIRNGNDIDTALCAEPFPFNNTSSNATAYYWDFGDGHTTDTKQPGSHTYEPGIYDVTLGVENGNLLCNDTITKSIIIFDKPEITLIGDTICQGERVYISSTGGQDSYVYNWRTKPSSVLENDTIGYVIDQPFVTTEYYLSVLDTNGCTDAATAEVFVYQPIELNDFDTIIVIGDSIFLPVGYDPNYFNYSWDPDTGLSCTNCPNPFVQPFEKIKYELDVSDKFGCFSDQAVFIIDVHPETFISIPTTFTPNNDGVNDVIYVEGWGIKELLEYKIYNRWGELVFETTNRREGWDGFYKGLLQNNDVYVVHVRAMTWKDEEHFYEGYINLMR